MDGVSVIVCCYNSSLKLLPTLSHLAKQKTYLPFEIIIIDNASTDNTFTVAQKIWTNLASLIPFKIIQEIQPGLSHARNKGMEAALYEYIVFCDDDNWLEENYIQLSYNFLKNNPTYAAIGGKSEAVFEDKIIPPNWFKELESCYAVGVQGSEGNITAKGYLWGAGIAFRKSIYDKLINKELPFLLTGRKGIDLSSGEDTEFCLRCVLIGYNIYFSSSLQLKHFISNSRLTEIYRDKLVEGLKNTSDILNMYFFYISINKIRSPYKQRIKLFIKYFLHLFKYRNLTFVDKKLIFSSTNYNIKVFDESFCFIRRLLSLKRTR